MSRPSFRLFSKWKAATILAALPSLAQAGVYAAEVLSYTPGASDPDYRTTSSILGAPQGVTGDNAFATGYFGFPNVLSPFSPAYQGDEITQIGEGGQITLRLSNFLIVGAGKRLGVISNVGLGDADHINYNSGHSENPATTFGGGHAQVRVSADNQTWVDLGTKNFDIPALYYVNAGAYDPAAPSSPQLTDFGKPFEGTLASLDNKDYASIIAAYAATGGGYSGGGNWIDVSTSGLTQIGYVQFLLPDNGDQITDRFSIDAVSIANGAVGAQTPEPGSAALLIAGATLLLRRRNKK